MNLVKLFWTKDEKLARCHRPLWGERKYSKAISKNKIAKTSLFYTTSLRDGQKVIADLLVLEPKQKMRPHGDRAPWHYNRIIKQNKRLSRNIASRHAWCHPSLDFTSSKGEYILALHYSRHLPLKRASEDVADDLQLDRVGSVSCELLRRCVCKKKHGDSLKNCFRRICMKTFSS